MYPLGYNKGIGSKRDTGDEKMTNELTTKVVTAWALGQQAFVNGKPCVPALDKNVKPLLSGLPVSKGAIAILNAWLKGWTEANLCADIQ
jgi:hypothetical protein